ncbi:MAG: DUF362 domain-containing protein [Flexilinea flocculi]|nr:DUF362 domain-containing protein [Flexilinea flocculi]
MEKSKVYFSDFRTQSMVNNLQLKLKKLMKTAGIGNIDFSHKYAAVKMHFGEPGNLAFLRPNFAKTVADVVKELGGRPYLTDCNTLYVGGRKDELVHLDTAYENGFSVLSTGCHIIIGDGLKGNDETIVPIDGQYVKEAKIGTAIMDADVIISLTHFKGHEGTGFGGTLKNLGMGCGSRAGKMDMHSNGKAMVNHDLCIGCGKCVKICAHNAPNVTNKKSTINLQKCVGCGRCIAICPVNAISPQGDSSNDILNCKIAEYAYAVVKDRPNFHISLVMDVSPNCDCHDENDLQIVPNVGMFASFDPVALDQACADAVNRQPVIPGSWLDEVDRKSNDHFHNAHPNTNWKVCLDHAEKIGLGTRNYELVIVK